MSAVPLSYRRADNRMCQRSAPGRTQESCHMGFQVVQGEVQGRAGKDAARKSRTLEEQQKEANNRLVVAR